MLGFQGNMVPTDIYYLPQVSRSGNLSGERIKKEHQWRMSCHVPDRRSSILQTFDWCEPMSVGKDTAGEKLLHPTSEIKKAETLVSRATAKKGPILRKKGATEESSDWPGKLRRGSWSTEESPIWEKAAARQLVYWRIADLYGTVKMYPKTPIDPLVWMRCDEWMKKDDSEKQ